MLIRIALLIIALLVSTLVAYAKPERREWSTLPTYALRQIIRNIPYRNSVFCTGDLSLPNREEACPVVILVHGGGWRGGDKCDPELQEIVATLVKRGYAVFNIDYRLSWQGGTFPRSVNDVIAAARYLTSNSQKYQVDPSRIALMGESAGGNLALMAGYNAKSSFSHGALSEGKDVIQAVVAFCPVIELSCLDRAFVAAYMDDTVEHSPELYKKASPSSYLERAVPTLCIQGTQDSVIPCAQAQKFIGLLKEKNVDAKLVMIPGAGHVFIHAQRTRAIDETCAFLACHL